MYSRLSAYREVANVTIHSDFSPLLPKVKIDRRRLSKVFVNLIENAIQHSPTAGVVKIEARQVSDGNTSGFNA
jgi:signal transduction histidine kinase